MTTVMTGSDLSRRLWERYEPVHALVYFSSAARAVSDSLGMRGFWMGYFAFRSAPLGAIDPRVVTAAFYGFAESRVRRALPDAWQHATPEQALTARLTAASNAWQEAGLLDAIAPENVTEAAEIAWSAAAAADTGGRVLAAANQALPRPRRDEHALWQALTTLREHRGDGHNAVLVAHGVGPVEAHLLKAAAAEADGEVLRAGRDHTVEAWVTAADALRKRGWLDAHGALTDAGRDGKSAIERATDAAATQPWDAIGPRAAERLLDLLTPLAALAGKVVPYPNPVGVRRPE
jgi:hypothetical protein